MEADLPAGVTREMIFSKVDAILRETSWDEITPKQVLTSLERTFDPSAASGWLKPFKKLVMEAVDAGMQAIMAAGGVGHPSNPAEPPPPAPPAPARPRQPSPERRKAAEEPAAAHEPPKKKRKKKSLRAEAEAESEGEAEPAPPPPPAAASEGEGGGEEAEEDVELVDDEEDGEEYDVKVVGKGSRGKGAEEGKVFYQALVKNDKQIGVGQDVYLENDEDIPYVARLQQIFVYAFAPREVYFTANWYYRVDDCLSYAKEYHGLKGDVQWEGSKLEAMPNELFFSLHPDENHADCILRTCTVYLHAEGFEPPTEKWNALRAHDYLVWRAYEGKRVFSLVDLPHKRFRDALEKELRRNPTLKGPAAPPKPKPKAEKKEPEYARGPLRNEELRGVWLRRKHLEVWLDTSSFDKVVLGSIVRCVQMLNGNRTFYAAYVVAIKRAPRPYKVGKKVAEVVLQVRTAMGTKLVGIDALSNEPPNDAELARFKLPLAPEEVRKKLRALERAFAQDADLFEEEEMQQRREQEYRAAEKRAEEEAQEQMQQEEREKKEREREEVRRRMQEKMSQQDSEQWWLQYKVSGGKARELAKWKARLTRFQKIANDSVAEGERDNAKRLADQAQEKINSLESATEAVDE